MRLVIQTNIPGGHFLWLVRGQTVDRTVYHRHAHHGADRLLAEIHRLLGDRKLKEIVVVRGPGAFTAIRAALVVANMLGWVWDIPVTGVVRKSRLTTIDVIKLSAGTQKKFGQAVRPWYGKKPNITVSKKRRYR